MLNIPTIPSQLTFAVSSLARAAFLFLYVVEAAEGKPIDDILADREEVRSELLLCDANTWALRRKDTVTTTTEGE